MADRTPFWMVKGLGPTQFKHVSEDAAVREAKRLARENPGHEFTVMVSTRSFEVADIIEHDRSPSCDGIPF